MPLATDALLADTTHMTTEEFGAYVRILLVMWRHGAKLTYNAEELARIAGVTDARWRQIEERVLRPMTHEAAGSTGVTLTQKKMIRTWLKVQGIRTKRALASQAYWRNRKKPGG